MNFNSTYIPYASKRYPIYAQHGMVCASSPQAAAAGLEVMRKGGNAMDAAVATSTALTAPSSLASPSFVTGDMTTSAAVAGNAAQSIVPAAIAAHIWRFFIKIPPLS